MSELGAKGEPIAEETQVQKDTKFCKHCGGKIPADAVVCPLCGRQVEEMIKEHVALTNSEKGKLVLEHFKEYLPKFKKIIPHDYERVLRTIVQMEEKGLSAEQAQIEAFYAAKKG